MSVDTRLGEIHKTKNYGDFEIIEYHNCEKVKVRFLDTGYETIAQYSRIKSGAVKDILKPSVCGVGIVGGEKTHENGKAFREYDIWAKMLKRVYRESVSGDKPTYLDVVVSENFKNFPYFKSWCYKQVGFASEDKWELDKDILVKGNKVYSEDTCCFVPREINVLFTSNKINRGFYPVGVHKRANKYVSDISILGKKVHLGVFDSPEEAFLAYKLAKEKHIKFLADKWKDWIDHRVYEALMNYEIEITD